MVVTRNEWRPTALVRRLAVLLVVVTVLAVFWTLQRRLIYFPMGQVSSPWAAGLPHAQEVSFATEDGLTLGGWFIPSARQDAIATVIVFNGNAGHRGFRAPLAAKLSEAGVATLLFDYRGFGGNPGAPSEAGLYRDARAALAYVTSRADVDARRVAYFGESLGTGVAVKLATERTPSKLILRSPFTSMTDVGRHHYPFLPVRWLLADRYPSADRIGRVNAPILVITADRDSVVPADQSRRLFSLARDPKRLMVIAGVDHNDTELLAGDQLVQAVVAFLRT